MQQTTIQQPEEAVPHDGCWQSAPLDILQHIGGLLPPSAVAAGRRACRAWRTGLSAGVTELRPRFAAKHSLGGAKWAELPAVHRTFPACRTLDLRRCKVNAAVAEAVAAALPTMRLVRLRMGCTVSVNKRKQCNDVRRLLEALGELQSGCGTVFTLEFEVLDGAFWWSDNLRDSNILRMFGTVPSNTLVERLDLTEHVTQNMTRASFRLLATLTPLRHLTLINSSTVSSAAVAELAPLTNLERLTLGAGMPVTDAGLAQTLGGMCRLRRLTLVELQLITNEGISMLADLHLPHLTHIGLKGFRNVSDAAMSALTRLTTLRLVDLASCHKVTDGGLCRLAALPLLRHVSVEGCHRVSPVGVRSLYERSGGRVTLAYGDGSSESRFGTSSKGCPLYASHYDRQLQRLRQQQEEQLAAAH